MRRSGRFVGKFDRHAAERRFEPVDGAHKRPLHAGRAAQGQVGENGVVIVAERIDKRQRFNINGHGAFSDSGAVHSWVLSDRAASSR